MSTILGGDNESKTTYPDETGSNLTRSTGDSENDANIIFLLQAAGGAPILKRRKWALPRSKTIGHIAEFLKKHMQLDSEQQKQLFLYVSQSFSPAFDTTIGAVNDCFNSEGTLVIHYTLTPAWG